MSKHRTTVFLETDMLNAIRKVAKEDERPMAYHYDKALRAYGPIKKLMATPKREVSKIGAKGCAISPEGVNRPAWTEWVIARKGKITEAAATKQWKLLLAYSEPEQQLIIDASINSGWQGLFPLKGQQRPVEDFVEKNTNQDWRKGV